MKELEIYIHIPFCMRKCLYCDFLSFPSDEVTMECYVNRMIAEIEKKAVEFLNYEVVSIFFGGGTPSFLKPEWIEKILCKLKNSFMVSEDAEISIEVNPGSFGKLRTLGAKASTMDAVVEAAATDTETTSADTEGLCVAGSGSESFLDSKPISPVSHALSIYRKCGINRLSIGLQSTHDSELKALGRIHTYSDFTETYLEARKAGFTNINVDLMSAIPTQTFASYCENLDCIISLKPEHVSSYSLIVEEGTYYYEHPQPLPDEDTERGMYYETDRRLIKAGYHRYEISNYAKEGFECKHNCGYWTGREYLGLGLGASSYIGGKRMKNCSDMKTYLGSDIVPFDEVIELSVKDRMEEYMFLGLRMMEGVSISEFQCCFHISLNKIYGSQMKELIEKGLLEEDGNRVRLTLFGIDVSNYVFEQFLL